MRLQLRGWIFAFICGGLLAAPAFGQVAVPSGGAASLSSGSALNLACTDLNVAGTTSVGAGQITQGANVNINPSGILDGGQGLISTGAGWNNAGSFNPGTGTVVFTDACSAGAFQLSGNTTFYNLTLTSSSGRTFVIPSGSHITVLGTLTLQGVGAPIQLVSSGGGTANITLGNGAQVVNSNAAVGADVQIGAMAPTAIPTLGEAGLAGLALLLMLAGAVAQPIPRLARGRAGQRNQ